MSKRMLWRRARSFPQGTESARSSGIVRQETRLSDAPGDRLARRAQSALKAWLQQHPEFAKELK